LAGKDVQHHRTSKKEVDEMRALVARDLADARVDGLSADRKYATAYNAALQAANMAIACAGYRVTAKTGHHKITFYSASLALGAGANKYADYFETCRRKRNVIDYTRSHVATETEAKEIAEQATQFVDFVESWIDSKFPNLKR
jgi:HEPN domain